MHNEGMKLAHVQTQRAASHWRETLSQIPSIFGQLSFLNSLRDPNSGYYVHYGIEQMVGKLCQEVLLKSHEEAFSEWMALELPEQLKDLNLYLSGLGVKKTVVLKTWAQLKPYEHFPPLSASDLDRAMFIANLQALLKLVQARIKV